MYMLGCLSRFAAVVVLLASMNELTTYTHTHYSSTAQLTRGRDQATVKNMLDATDEKIPALSPYIKTRPHIILIFMQIE